MKHRSLRLLTVLGVVALFAAACQAATPSGSGGAAAAAGGGPDGALVKRSDIKIEIVTHGQKQDGFWGVVQNGVKAGASQMGVTANYSAPNTESGLTRKAGTDRILAWSVDTVSLLERAGGGRFALPQL